MGRLVLDEEQEPIYAMQLSGVHIGKVVKVGTTARRKLTYVYHRYHGIVETGGYARAGNSWNTYSNQARMHSYDDIVEFYKEEETRAKH